MGQITEQDLEDMFDDMLDEQGEVEVAGSTLYPSRILKACDPVAYRCGLNDYADALIEDGYDVEGY